MNIRAEARREQITRTAQLSGQNIDRKGEFLLYMGIWAVAVRDKITPFV